MSPVVAHAIDSLQSKVDNYICATPATQPDVHVDQKTALVLYIFRVPGGQDLCLSTFKPHHDVVTGLDILLSAYYVRCNDDSTLQVLRGGQCVATLINNQIEVKLRIEDPADTKDETVVIRKRIDNKCGNYFTTSIQEVERAAGHKKSFSSAIDSNGQSPYTGLNMDQLTLAAARSGSELAQAGPTSTQQLKEKLRTAKRSLATSEFKDQRGQRCLFYSSVTGQDLKCDQVVSGGSTSNTGIPISELRFNLPAMTNRANKKDSRKDSSEDNINNSGGTYQSSQSIPRHKRFSVPLNKLVRGHSSNKSEDVLSNATSSPAPLQDVSSFRMSLPQPDLGHTFQVSGYIDDNGNDWSRSSSPPRPMISSRSSDEMAPPLPIRPLHSISPLQTIPQLHPPPPPPPRHQTQSESAIDTGKSFGIKRKAVNRSENSPVFPASEALPPSPPKHDAENYPFPSNTPPTCRLPVYTDPAPPYDSSPALSPTAQPFPPPLSSTEQPLPPTSPLSPGRLDLSLGQEALGGGFRGQAAKLGKLLVFADGTKTLDLVVAANVAMFWRAWKGGRARSGSASFG